MRKFTQHLLYSESSTKEERNLHNKYLKLYLRGYNLVRLSEESSVVTIGEYV